MFTDMVGYTALGQRNEELSLALVEEQRKLIRPLLLKHDGKEIKTIGDAFLLEFPNAVDAVRCAYDIQRAARELNFSLASDKRIHLRIGIHVGEVVESQGDISGDAVNVASRIEPLAEDGGVCMTRQVFDHVQNKFELQLASIGNRQLKNVSVPVEVFRMAMPWDAAAEFDRRKMAILPFENISPDPNDEYFADGLTDELISTISKVGGISVIARTSIIGYKGGQKKVKEIAKELEVGTVLEGTVRKAGNKLRITAQLIDTQTSDHLWAESYDRELKDVFEIQSEIAHRVSKSLALRLLPKEEARIKAVPTRNLPAFENYLKGMQLLYQGRFEDTRRAKEHLETAISMDPNFAPAFAALGDMYVLLAGDRMPAEQAFTEAERLIERALEMDENLSEAHTAKANLAMQHRLDWQTAKRELEKAIALNPSNSTAHSYYATLLNLSGNIEKALNEVDRAQELDPLSVMVRYQHSSIRIFSRDYKQALPHAERAAQLMPNDATARQILATAYYLCGMTNEARREMRASLKLEKDPGVKAWAVYMLSTLGMVDEARNLATEVESEKESVRYPGPELAVMYLALGERERALGLLESSFNEAPVTFLFNFRWPAFDPVRGDPKFEALVARLNLPKEPL